MLKHIALLCAISSSGIGCLTAKLWRPDYACHDRLEETCARVERVFRAPLATDGEFLLALQVRVDPEQGSLHELPHDTLGTLFEANVGWIVVEAPYQKLPPLAELSGEESTVPDPTQRLEVELVLKNDRDVRGRKMTPKMTFCVAREVADVVRAAEWHCTVTPTLELPPESEDLTDGASRPSIAFSHRRHIPAAYSGGGAAGRIILTPFVFVADLALFAGTLGRISGAYHRDSEALEIQMGYVPWPFSGSTKN